MSTPVQLTGRALRNQKMGNVCIGAGLFGFCAAVYAYSIVSVKQEKFDDVDAMVAETKRKRALEQHSSAAVHKDGPTSTANA